MQIREPIVFEIAHRTWCINEFGMDALFLLEGDDRALLIDTGTSVFDIPALVRRYTDKPLTVALTHGHIDHAGGISWFEQVYAHPADFAMARRITVADRADYVGIMTQMSGDLYELTPAHVANGPYDTQLLPLCDGTVFHLGNRDVVAYETPGHTPGGMSYLDVRERILYTGDACNMNTLLACGTGREAGTVSGLLATAKKIEGLHPYYDRNYNGHIGYAAAITHMGPMPECLTRDCIALCEALLGGSVVGEATHNPFRGDCLIARGGTMQIVYTRDQLA